MGKIIFLDIDGTITDYENNIPDSAITAIRNARKNGHKVYMCTGRSKAEMPEELWDIGFDGYIGANGSYIEDNGNIVFHQVLSLEQCTEIVDWLHGRKDRLPKNCFTILVPPKVKLSHLEMPKLIFQCWNIVPLVWLWEMGDQRLKRWQITSPTT